MEGLREGEMEGLREGEMDKDVREGKTDVRKGAERDRAEGYTGNHPGVTGGLQTSLLSPTPSLCLERRGGGNGHFSLGNDPTKLIQEPTFKRFNEGLNAAVCESRKISQELTKREAIRHWWSCDMHAVHCGWATHEVTWSLMAAM